MSFSRQFSLRTRITLHALVVFVLGIWLVAYFAGRLLQDDMRRVLGEQQFSAVSFMAEDLDGDLGDRLNVLTNIAGRIGPATLADAPALQAYLDERMVLQIMFSGGLVAVAENRQAVANSPAGTVRAGTNSGDIDAIRTALQEGRPAVGAPKVGKEPGTLAFAIAAPIRDGGGRVVGALAGVVDLGKPNFIDKIGRNTFGRTGGYFLVSKSDRLIIMASDKSRIMENLPAPGVIPASEPAYVGDLVGAVWVNPRGVEVLVSAKGLSNVGWFVGATLPTDEAFAPIHAMQRRLLVATTVLTLLLAALTWWSLRRQLSPLMAAISDLSERVKADRPADPIPVVRHDEVGDLIDAVNGLLRQAKTREDALRNSELRFRDLVNTTDGLVWEADADSFTFTFISEKAEQMLGFPVSDWLKPGFWAAHLHPDDAIWAPEYCASCTRRIEPHDFEYRFIARDGRVVWLRDIVTVVAENGRPRWLRGVMIDISKQKLIEAALREANRLAEDVQQISGLGGWKYDCATARVTWTKEVYRLHGVGEDFDSSDATRNFAFFCPEDGLRITAAFKRAVEDGQPYDLELRLMRSSGEIIWVRTVARPQIEQGRVTSVTGNIIDITERKRVEEEVWSLAFCDTLTGLPNRRLLLDRLRVALASSARSTQRGALLFIDLDDFKSVNDTLGHEAGDFLLQEVATRLKHCVREGDTVARLGGDEFVVMLDRLDAQIGVALAQAATVAEKILERLRGEFLLGEYRARCTPSIGIALFDGTTPSEADLLRQADHAMYQAKAAGRNAMAFHAPQTPNAAPQTEGSSALLPS